MSVQRLKMVEATDTARDAGHRAILGRVQRLKMVEAADTVPGGPAPSTPPQRPAKIRPVGFE